jgi:hypothetical protein
MSEVLVRPFRRPDREQLTALVNAHVQAVVPGVSVPVNTVLSQLERDPGEFIVDPWVAERATLVAEQRGRVVAAAHLLRYGAGAEVGESYRDTAEIKWLLFWPEASYWPDSAEAAGALMGACLDRLRAWGQGHWHAGGSLMAPGVYDMPEQWPHVRALYEQAGFVHDGHTEIVLLASVDELPRPSRPPIDGLELGRALGVNGTRLYGHVGDKLVGYVEVDTQPGPGGTAARLRLARGRGLPGPAPRPRIPRAHPHRPRLAPPPRRSAQNRSVRYGTNTGPDPARDGSASATCSISARTLARAASGRAATKLIEANRSSSPSRSSSCRWGNRRTWSGVKPADASKAVRQRPSR